MRLNHGILSIKTHKPSHKINLRSAYFGCAIFASSKKEQVTTFPYSTRHNSGPGSSVGIATDYRLDGSGSNPGGNVISGPALGPNQPPVKWVPGLSRG